MPSTSRIDIRLTEEEKNKALEQAKKVLGESGTISEYFRLIINLDAATNLIASLVHIKELVVELEKKAKDNRIK
jgi:hypothetical protein